MRSTDRDIQSLLPKKIWRFMLTLAAMVGVGFAVTILLVLYAYNLRIHRSIRKDYPIISNELIGLKFNVSSEFSEGTVHYRFQASPVSEIYSDRLYEVIARKGQEINFTLLIRDDNLFELARTDVNWVTKTDPDGRPLSLEGDGVIGGDWSRDQYMRTATAEVLCNYPLLTDELKMPVIDPCKKGHAGRLSKECKEAKSSVPEQINSGKPERSSLMTTSTIVEVGQSSISTSDGHIYIISNQKESSLTYWNVHDPVTVGCRKSKCTLEDDRIGAYVQALLSR